MKRSLDFLLGLFCGVLLLLSCDEDSPPEVDAAVTCDCAAAEPPIPPRITEEIQVVTIPPPNLPAEDGREYEGVECPMGSILLHAGCSANDGQTADVVLEQSFSRNRAWICGWRNTGTVPVTGRAIARCLIPTTAQQ